MDEEKTTETNEEQRKREAQDVTTDHDLGSGGAYGPPVTGERGDPKRDPESGVPREEPDSEPGDIKPTDDPTLGKDTHGG